MSIAILILVKVVVTAVGLGLCHRELRSIGRGLGALDEGAGRRAAEVVAGLQGLREPLEAIRAPRGSSSCGQISAVPWSDFCGSSRPSTADRAHKQFLRIYDAPRS
jgi:hypothetical protein